MSLHVFLYCSLPYFLRYCLSPNLEQLTDLTRLGWLVCKLNGFACLPSPAQLPVGSAEVLVPAHLVKEYWRESSQAITKAVSGRDSVSRGCGDGETFVRVTRTECHRIRWTNISAFGCSWLSSKAAKCVCCLCGDLNNLSAWARPGFYPPGWGWFRGRLDLLAARKGSRLVLQDCSALPLCFASLRPSCSSLSSWLGSHFPTWLRLWTPSGWNHLRGGSKASVWGVDICWWVLIFWAQ